MRYPSSAQCATAALVPAAPSTSTHPVNVGSSQTRPKEAKGMPFASSQAGLGSPWWVSAMTKASTSRRAHIAW